MLFVLLCSLYCDNINALCIVIFFVLLFSPQTSLYCYSACIVMLFLVLFSLHCYALCIIMLFVILLALLFCLYCDSLYYHALCIVMLLLLLFSLYCYSACIVVQALVLPAGSDPLTPGSSRHIRAYLSTAFTQKKKNLDKKERKTKKFLTPGSSSRHI